MTKPKQPSREQQAKVAQEILRVRNDLFYFLENYCWTLDEDERRIRRFPTREERPELYELAKLWLNTDKIDDQRKLGINKSRQMMGTWVFLCCDLWDTAFHEGVLTFFQSKKEKDAINLLDRAWITFQKLPPWLKPTHQKKETELLFPHKNSKIWAIPQGGDHIRSYTASNIFDDEAAKQPEFGEAFAAGVPSIGKYGRLHFLSTARGKANAFYRLYKKPGVKEKLDEVEYPLLKPKINTRNITTAFLDYRFNPKYDKQWEINTRATMTEAEWNREYEGSFEEAVGTPVLVVESSIHFRNLAHINGKPFWRGWDFGYRKPACIVTQMNLNDQWCWLWGTVGENETIKRFANRMFEMCDALFPQVKDEHGRPVGQNWLDFCDPAGTQVSDKSDTTSIAQLMTVYEERYDRLMDMNYRKRSFEDGIALIRERLVLRNDGQPGLLIHEDFDDAKDAVNGGYQYPEDRKSGAVNEYPMDDGYFIHLMDGARYIANCKFELAESKAEIEHEKWPEAWNDLGDPRQQLVMAG